MVKFKNLLHTACLIAIFCMPTAAHAELTALDVQDILVNLQKILDPALILLLTISFIIGIFFILKGLLLLKAFAMPLTQASRPGELSGPLIYLLVGTVMIYIPTSTDVITSTLFGSAPSMFDAGGGASVYRMGQASDQIMGYASVALESQWATLINTVVYYMQFIGFLAFMRGWIIISHAAQHHGQEGSLSKGLIHIVGGILAINFLPLIKAISNTIGGTA